MSGWQRAIDVCLVHLRNEEMETETHTENKYHTGRDRIKEETDRQTDR